MNKKGFTIVELVIVIAVIAILAAVLIPTFSGIVEKAKQSAALQEVKTAYTEALATDLSDTDATNDVVYNTTVKVQYTGFYVEISANGEAKVVTGTADAATHTYNETTGVLTKN